jgi:hypothetical protein
MLQIEPGTASGIPPAVGPPGGIVVMIPVSGGPESPGESITEHPIVTGGPGISNSLSRFQFPLTLLKLPLTLLKLPLTLLKLPLTLETSAHALETSAHALETSAHALETSARPLEPSSS